MDERIKTLIDEAKEKNIRGVFVDRETLIEFLKLDPYSEECEYLGQTARELARECNGNKARIGTSMGVDLAPCTMNCKFCSLGEKWGLFSDTYEMSPDEIVSVIREVFSKGFFQFTIRTTQFYGIDRLCELAKKIRKEVPGVYGLNVNTGELTKEEANRLYEAGFTGAYHTVRLGEGVDTIFDPEERIQTMRNIKSSKLMLSCGLDPIGIEHTPEQIADRLILFQELDPVSVCTMKRINVKGTPMEGIEEISNKRLAQCAAVIRMASGGRWNVPVHPIIKEALDWGANLMAVDYGAIPRKGEECFGKWSPMNHEAALQMFIDAGYDIGTAVDFTKRT